MGAIMDTLSMILNNIYKEHSANNNIKSLAKKNGLTAKEADTLMTLCSSVNQRILDKEREAREQRAINARKGDFFLDADVVCNQEYTEEPVAFSGFLATSSQDNPSNQPFFDIRTSTKILLMAQKCGKSCTYDAKRDGFSFNLDEDGVIEQFVGSKCLFVDGELIRGYQIGLNWGWVEHIKL